MNEGFIDKRKVKLRPKHLFLFCFLFSISSSNKSTPLCQIASKSVNNFLGYFDLKKFDRLPPPSPLQDFAFRVSALGQDYALKKENT